MESPGPGSRAGKPPWALIAAAALAAVVAGHLVPLADRGPFVDAVQGALHLPVFAAVALLLLAVIGARRPAWGPAARAAAALLALATLGASLEALQPLSGRSLSLGDYINDLVGGAAGIALWSALRRVEGGRRAAPAPLVAAIVIACVAAVGLRALPLARQYQARAHRAEWLPVLFDPAIEASRCFLFEQEARSSFSPPPPAWGDSSRRAVLRVAFARADYSAVGLHGLHPDWSGYGALCFPYLLEGDVPLALKAIVEDDRGAGSSRVGRADFRLALAPGPGRACVPFGDDGTLYTGRIIRLRLAAGRAAVVFFGEFRLEQPAKDGPGALGGKPRPGDRAVALRAPSSGETVPPRRRRRSPGPSATPRAPT